MLHSFLTSALDGGKGSASHPGCFTPKEGTHCTEGWVSPQSAWTFCRI